MNRQDFEKSLEKAVRLGVQKELKAPVYIASGFFNEAQNAILTELESLLDAQGINYISPRKEGVVNVNSPMRSAMMGEIFDQNIRNIKESEKCYFLLDRSLGAYDLGTTFELGYALGQYVQEKKNLDNLVIYSSTDEEQEMFESVVENVKDFLSKEYTPTTQEKTLLLYKDNAAHIEKSTKLLYPNIESKRVNSYLENIAEMAVGEPLLLIDNRPWQVAVLAGIFYAKGIPFNTCSLKNFESNIMISKAASGHINLQGFYDPAKNPSIKIT